jgi:hypothetical protein
VTARALGAAALALACAACQTRRVASADAPRADDAPPAQEGRAGPRERTDGAGPPVPATPGGLLAPGGARRIKLALAERGLLGQERVGRQGGDELDEATSAALRRFQRDEGLAATGFPDRETLRRLGLEPADVYETQPDAEHGAAARRRAD